MATKKPKTEETPEIVAKPCAVPGCGQPQKIWSGSSGSRDRYCSSHLQPWLLSEEMTKLHHLLRFDERFKYDSHRQLLLSEKAHKAFEDRMVVEGKMKLAGAVESVVVAGEDDPGFIEDPNELDEDSDGA